MPALERYRIKGDYSKDYEIIDNVSIGASASGISNYGLLTPKINVTDKTEFINNAQTSTGYITLNFTNSVELNENDLPVNIGANIDGIISYQDSSGVANPANIIFKRYNEGDDTDTVYLCSTSQNAIDILSAGTKETPYKTLKYALSHLNGKNRLCILDAGNYSSEPEILLSEIANGLTIFSNYYPSMPQVNIDYNNTTSIYEHTFKGLKWSGRTITVKYIPVNDDGYLIFDNCFFETASLDIHHTYYKTEQLAVKYDFLIGIYNSVIKNSSLKIGRFYLGSDMNYRGIIKFYNNRCLYSKCIIEGKYASLDYSAKIVNSSFVVNSGAAYDITFKGAVEAYKTNFLVNTTYTGYGYSALYPSCLRPTLRNCVFNQSWYSDGDGITLTDNNFKDASRNQLKTYENITKTASLSSLILQNDETDYIGTDRVGYTEDFSYDGINFKSYLFDKSENLLFSNITFNGNKQIDGLFKNETQGYNAQITNCTFKNFTGKISKSISEYTQFIDNVLPFEYESSNDIERNIFAFNEIAVALNNASGCVINHNTFYSNLVGIYNISGNSIGIENNIIYSNISHSIKSSETISLSEDNVNLIDNIPENIESSGSLILSFNPFFKNEIYNNLDLHLMTVEEGYDFDSIAKEKSSDIPKQDLGAYNVSRLFNGYDYKFDFYIDRPNPKKRSLKEINATINVSREGSIFTNEDQTIMEEVSLFWEALDKNDMDNLRVLFQTKNNVIDLYEFPESGPMNIKQYYIDKTQSLNYERVDNFNSGEDIYKNVELKLIRKAEIV